EARGAGGGDGVEDLHGPGLQERLAGGKRSAHPGGLLGGAAPGQELTNLEAEGAGGAHRLAEGLLGRGVQQRAVGLPAQACAHFRNRKLVFEATTGARSAGGHVPAPDPAAPRGIVVLAHPDRRYGQHWFVRTGWIDWLRAQGFACLTFDFSQYGASRGGSAYLF